MAKFQRIAPGERREALLVATLRCLLRHGLEGVSVRRISAEAGVTMGLINHYFGGSADLVAAAYERLAHAYLDEAERASSASANAEPAARLRLFFRTYFAPNVVDPGVFRVWLVFWSLMPQSPQMRAAHRLTSGRNRALLESLLRELRRRSGVAPFRVAAAATGLTALMDGLWVTLSLDPSALRPVDAVRRCEDWVAALSAGALPGLCSRPAPRRAPSAAASRSRARNRARTASRPRSRNKRRR